MTHTYYLEDGHDHVLFEIDRKTRPRMGAVISAYGSKWQIWYIEDQEGKYRARCDRLRPQ